MQIHLQDVPKTKYGQRQIDSMFFRHRQIFPILFPTQNVGNDGNSSVRTVRGCNPSRSAEPAQYFHQFTGADVISDPGTFNHFPLRHTFAEIPRPG